MILQQIVIVTLYRLYHNRVARWQARIAELKLHDAAIHFAAVRGAEVARHPHHGGLLSLGLAAAEASKREDCQDGRDEPESRRHAHIIPHRTSASGLR